MGAYLSEPITRKESSDEDAKNLAYGASSMQGWRMTQEDAHNCCIDFDENVSLFAVYDGHGGHEVAQYCAKHLPKFIKNTEAYKRGDMQQALIDAFLGFDATLATPAVMSILKELAGTQDPQSDSEDEDENIDNLCEEANMPLDAVMDKYMSKLRGPNAGETRNKALGRPNQPSPCLRNSRLRDKSGAACSSSQAGCSTSSASSSSWNTNETDVSSSSQPSSSQACASSSSANEKPSIQACASSSSANEKTVVSAGSSETDQVLDSTTSNGDVPPSSQVGSSADSQPAKSSEMPDSSEDVDDKVSHSKESKESDVSCTPSGVEVNGKNPSNSVGDADSSKAPNDDECSSSCTPLENGEAEELAKISSTDKKKNEEVPDVYKFLLNKDDENKADSNDEDEDDANFNGQESGEEENDDDDEESEVSDDDDEDDDDDDDDDEDDNDNGEEEEEEDDDDDEDDSNLLTEEPGADSGCTAVVALLHGKELFVANAGDSRCVLCRDGNAVELSFDHKPEDQPEMERIVKAGGKVTPDGRVNGGLNLSRALGDHAYKKNKELPPQEQMISALPDIKTATIDPEKDEFMVLACDGIWNFMSSENVIKYVRNRLQKGCDKLSDICEELFDHCLAPNTLGDGTGCDNMTAIIIRFKKPAEGVDGNATAEVATVNKKRPMSPSSSPAKEAKDLSPGAKVVEECKRHKMETETC